MRRSLLMNRRTVLRGLGTVMALPLLESMTPTSAFGGVTKPSRLSVFYMPNGMRMENFTPERSGYDFPISPTLEPLAAMKAKLSVVTGLSHNNANPLGDPGGAHGRSCAAFLTGAHAKPTEGSDLFCGISMDQLIANRVGQDTAFSSLELGLEPSSLLGSCDIGFSCTYTNTISWKSPTQALPVMVNPRDVFERLFGDNLALDERSRQLQMRRKTSILDFVRQDAMRIGRQLGANDRRKMDEYLQSVREVEGRIQKLANQKIDMGATDIVLPSGIPDAFEDHLKIMLDLQVLAMQTDMTRVCTFMLGRELSNRAYPEIGVPDSHHSLSHHGGNAEKIEKLHKINQYHLKQFGYLLERLNSTPDGEGSLLDDTLVLAGASLGEPNDHDCMDLPAIVAGGGLSGNRHISLPEQTPMCNLLLSMIQAMGVNAESFGDSTGTVPGLLG
ncbi:MAG: hypothetical protein ACI8PP_002545 [Candidatus Pseudothioglobus sp.]|jgi:hypothetical protein